MNDKIKDLVKRLIAFTENGKLTWEKTSLNTEFKTDLKDGSVSTDNWEDEELGLTRFVDFKIFNSNGDEIGNWIFESSSDDFEFLNQLHSAVKRKYLKIDETLDGFFNELQ